MARLRLRVCKTPWLVAALALLLPVATREMNAPETPDSRKRLWVEVIRLLHLLGFDYEPVAADDGPREVSA